MDETPSSGGSDLKRLARGGLLNLFGAGVAGVSGFVLVLVVAHGYPQEIAGAFFAATSLFLILSATSGLGTDAGLVRWLPRHLALGELATARRTVPIALGPVLVISMIAAAIMEITAPWIGSAIDGTTSGQITLMLRIMCGFLPIAAAHDALLAATRGYGAMRPTVAIEKIFRQSAQVGCILLAQSFTDGAGWLALAWVAPYLPGLVVAAVWFADLSRRHAGVPDTGQAEAPLSDWALARDFWSYTGPRAVAQICQTALQRADIMMVATFSSPRNAAVYTVATRFVVIGQLGAQAIQQVLQPAASRSMALNDIPATLQLLRASTTWTVIISWPLYLAVAVSAQSYLALFGDGYTGSGTVTTVILALTMLFATACGPVDVILLMAGRSGLSLVNNLSALTANIGTGIVLIPIMGLTGGAVARSAALCTRNILPLIQVRRSLDINPIDRGVLTAISYAALCFGVIPLSVTIASSNPLALLGALIFGTLCYGLLLWRSSDSLYLRVFRLQFTRRRAASSTPEKAGAPHA